jgi:hypothetical protein
VRNDECFALGTGKVLQLPVRDGETEHGRDGSGSDDLRSSVRERDIKRASRTIFERAGELDAGGSGEF